jgi:AmiR/NasT family two-component response regulator
MAGAEQQQRLRSAMQTRDLIGQAKGILMERFKITGDQAFRVLVHASQTSNRKLAEIAEDLVDSGELPTRPPAGR